jgi:hypothetical protein
LTGDVQQKDRRWRSRAKKSQWTFDCALAIILIAKPRLIHSLAGLKQNINLNFSKKIEQTLRSDLNGWLYFVQNNDNKLGKT